MQTSRTSIARARQVEKYLLGQDVLEIGFWDHNDLWEHHAKLARSWTGLDFNEEPVRLAREKGYQAVQCDLEKEELPKLEGTITCILMRHFLEHYDAAGALLLALNTRYRPKTIVIEVPNAGWWALPFYTAMTPIHLEYHFPLHVREFLPRHFYEIAKRSKVLKVTQIEHLHSYGTTPLGHSIDYAVGMVFPKLRRNLLCVMEALRAPH